MRAGPGIAAAFAVALCAGLLPGAAESAQVAGVTVLPVETVQGARLRLVGCAAREMLWKELYALSLYLPRPVGDASDIQGGSMPKLLRLDVTYDGKVPDGLPEDWAGRLREQVSREFMRTLRGLYNELRGGDTVRIAYTSGEGTTVTVNGRVVASRPGNELMDGVLGLWIGRDPLSENMKRLLLSGSC